MAKHIFTSVAPEDNLEGLSSKYLETWKWCIRCGVLKLGHRFFQPGPNQTMVLQSHKRGNSPPCKQRSKGAT